jgi:lactate dehydrogenase-like 2-hydroxyacid dehydrogenase
MSKPVLLMMGPMMPLVGDTLSQRFTVEKLWEQPDPQAFLAARGPEILAVAAGGPSKIKVDEGLITKLPGVKLVSSFGVGYDHIDAPALHRHGVVVTHTPDVLNEEVADTALALLLSAVREIPQADHYLRSGQWLKGPYPLTASLRGRKAGILGLGRIGKAIARRLEAFGLPVSYFGRNPQKDVAYPYFSSPVALAKEVDVLISVMPGGKATEKLINAEVLSALGPNGVFVNIGRGTSVDEVALIKALQDKTILAAGLDVFADEPRVPQALIDCPNTTLLPHVGSATHDTRRAMAQLVIDNLFALLEGKPPLSPVPETPWAGAYKA